MSPKPNPPPGPKAGKRVFIRGTFTLLPAAKGCCEQCAAEHEVQAPHNAQSLHYQYWFYGKHGRWPTWDDALAHCSEEVQRKWRAALIAKGIKIGSEPVFEVEREELSLPRVLLITCGKWRRAYPMQWLHSIYYCGDEMRSAWAYPGVIVPEGCSDIMFFREWLCSCLYEGGESSGRLRVGRRTIRVEVLNGSVFEEK